MSVTFPDFTDRHRNRDFLISTANGFQSIEPCAVLVPDSATAPPAGPRMLSGVVLGGAINTKAAELYGGTVLAEHNAAGVAGAATAIGILLDDVYSEDGTLFAASGRITFSDQPGNDTTITLNGAALTFKASGAAGETEVNKGGSLDATLTAAAAKLNAATATTAWTGATYYATATTLEIVHDTAGSAGNAYTVVAGASSNGTVLAATLIGGGYIVPAAYIERDAEVKDGELRWFTGATDQQKTTAKAALLTRGIKVRPTGTYVTS